MDSDLIKEIGQRCDPREQQSSAKWQLEKSEFLNSRTRLCNVHVNTSALLQFDRLAFISTQQMMISMLNIIKMSDNLRSDDYFTFFPSQSIVYPNEFLIETNPLSCDLLCYMNEFILFNEVNRTPEHTHAVHCSFQLLSLIRQRMLDLSVELNEIFQCHIAVRYLWLI